MLSEVKKYVIQILDDYLSTNCQINLLQHELSSFMPITPEEMMETMVYAKREGGASARMQASDKTARIALTYRDKTDQVNESVQTSILDQLRPLLIRKERLDYCMLQLSPIHNKILHEMYMQHKDTKMIASEMHLSERTIQRYRDKAIHELTAMYELLEKMGVVLE